MNGGTVSIDHEAIAKAIVGVIVDWQNRLIQVITTSLSKAWEEAGRKWQESTAASYAKQQEVLLETWETVSQDWKTTATETSKNQQQTLDKMAAERESLQEEAKKLLSNMTNVLKSEQDSIKEILGTTTETVQKQHNMVQSYVGALQRAGGKLGELVQLQNKLEEGLLRAAGSDGLAAVLKDVRGALSTMDPALRKLVDKPIDVEVHFVAGPPAVTGG